MKIFNLSIENSVQRRTKQYLELSIIALLVSLLSACQLTNPMNKDSSDATAYSQYYICLKSLEKSEVIAEEAKYKSLITNRHEDNQLNQGKLILIYSLPNTPLHNPYKAKRLLNEHLLANDSMSKENLAFTMLLKDQLNTQLHLLSSQEKSKKTFNQKNSENQKNIKELSQQLEHVNHQLKLLKQIDQNINDRD